MQTPVGRGDKLSSFAEGTFGASNTRSSVAPTLSGASTTCWTPAGAPTRPSTGSTGRTASKPLVCHRFSFGWGADASSAFNYST